MSGPEGRRRSGNSPSATGFAHLVLGTIAVMVAAFAADETTGVVVLFLPLLSALIYLIAIRLWLELIVVAFNPRRGRARGGGHPTLGIATCLDVSSRYPQVHTQA